MVEFKQKNFFLLSALTAGSMVQTHKQMKQEKEQADAVAAQNDQITKQLNDLARQVKKNPELASKAGEIMSTKTFSIPRVKTFGLFDVAALPVMLAQGKKQNELAEEIGQQQDASMRKMGKALERIQENAQKAYEERGYSVLQKTYANAAMFKGIENVANRLAKSKGWQRVAGSNTYKNARGFVNDISTVAKEGQWGQRAADMAAMGTVIAGTGYLVDKAIQRDSKKLGAPITAPPQVEENDKNKPEHKGLKTGILAGAGTLGAAGTALVLARKGKLNSQTFKNIGSTIGKGFKKQFVKGPATQNELDAVKARMIDKGRSSAKIEKRLARMSKNRANVGSILGNLGFASVPAIGYLAQRKQLKDQVQVQEQQSQQKVYSIHGALKIRRLLDSPRKLVEGLSFGAGRTAQKNLGWKLSSLNNGSGSTWTKKASDFLKSNKGGALKAAGGLVVGSSVMMAPWTIGESATRKAISAVDKNAFAYEKSQQQTLESTPPPFPQTTTDPNFKV